MPWQLQCATPRSGNVLRAIPRQILKRCFAVLAALLALFSLAVAVLYMLKERSKEQVQKEEREHLAHWIDGVLQAGGKPLRLFVESYSRRISFTRPDRESVGASPEATLSAGLRTYELDAAWVLEADGSVRLQVHDPQISMPLPPPISLGQLVTIPGRTTHFFVERMGVAYEVRGSRLAGSTVPVDRRGWLFAAIALDREGALAPLTRSHGELSLLLPAETPAPPALPHSIEIERVLTDITGSPVRVLRFESEPLAVDTMARMFRLELAVMAGFAVLSLLVLFLSLWRWIVFPARIIHLSLVRDDTAVLQPLHVSGGDMGKLAGLVQRSIESRRELERSIAERAQLGRNLHDQVLQTLYAAGLGLSSAREVIEERPGDARRVIDDTRRELNGTIVDLRRFIAGLEPEDLCHHTFAEAVQSVVAFMQAVRPVRFTIEVDDDLAARLTPIERMHLLQVTREAVSNSVRHSGADRILIAWRAESEGAILEIADNGRGFDPERASGGHGLANFNARALALGGAVTMETDLNTGTVVRLVLPRFA